MKGFRSFILRGNAVDLAVGIVIGAAFTAVVNGFVLRAEGVPRTALANLPMPARWWPSARTIPPMRCAVRAGGCCGLGPIPGNRPQGLYEVPTDYPGEHLADFVHVDEEAGRIYVARREPARITEYVLPLTGERRAALQAYTQAYGRSVAAYAVVGANQEAAAALAGTVFTPRTACTRCCASSRSATLPTPPP